MPATADEVLRFWFADSVGPDAALHGYERRWFRADPVFDETIRGRFGDLIGRAGAGEFDDWARTPRGRLALIVLLDQFPRNAFRGNAAAFASDAYARAVCQEGLVIQADRTLAAVERLFFYLPLMHSECRADQERSVACFDALSADAEPRNAAFFAEWARRARRQRAMVALFGRFPRRNAVLGRVPRVVERIFLRICAALARAKRD